MSTLICGISSHGLLILLIIFSFIGLMKLYPNSIGILMGFELVFFNLLIYLLYMSPMSLFILLTILVCGTLIGLTMIITKVLEYNVVKPYSFLT